MKLHETLPLSPGAIVAAVGAGGKTTILSRLAAELAALGGCIISTTTTAMWEPETPAVIEPDSDALLSAVAVLVQPGRVITVARGRQLALDEVSGRQRAKLSGILSADAARLAALPGAGYVLVEADGARGRAIKAPAEHEPVIPPPAALVLAVVSIEALGKPLSPAIAHRPERIAALLGLESGAALGPEQIATLLAHAQGGRKGVPPAARFIPFINKVEDEASLQGARSIASCLRALEGIDRVLIGAALAPEPVLEVW